MRVPIARERKIRSRTYVAMKVWNDLPPAQYEVPCKQIEQINFTWVVQYQQFLLKFRISRTYFSQSAVHRVYGHAVLTIKQQEGTGCAIRMFFRITFHFKVRLSPLHEDKQVMQQTLFHSVGIP